MQKLHITILQPERGKLLIMSIEDFEKKHGSTFFAFHKVQRGLKAVYTNTEEKLWITGNIAAHSNLDLTEDGSSLVIELENIKIGNIA